jgi:hypothetical protein
MRSPINDQNQTAQMQRKLKKGQAWVKSSNRIAPLKNEQTGVTVVAGVFQTEASMHPTDGQHTGR